VSREEAFEHAYARAGRLVDDGRRDEALAALQECLRLRPDDGRALNDSAALLYAAGRLDEAVAMFRRAVDAMPDAPGQPLWNLAEALLAAKRAAEVLPLFDALNREDLLSADLANRVAAALLEAGDAGRAVEAMLASLKAAPDQPALEAIHEQVRGLRPKVAFLADFDDRKFLGDIHAYVRDRYPARTCIKPESEDLVRTLQWADVAWVEWCTNLAVVVSRLPKVCRTIVRLHRFEAFGTWPAKVQWENIDALLLVGNPTVRERLRRNVPDIEQRTRVLDVPNGVDLERFPLADRPRGKNLACVGYISLHKNPMLLLQAFQRLHAQDPEYRLHFAGSYQDDGLLQAYLENTVSELGLEDAVRFDGWQKDVAAWLADKHYLVSASVVEGHPVSVLEAMARGLKPVVHVFPGSRAVLPEDSLWRTVDEFCERILGDPYQPQAYRDFVAERYPLSRQLAAVQELLDEFEASPVPRQETRHATEGKQSAATKPGPVVTLPTSAAGLLARPAAPAPEAPALPRENAAPVPSAAPSAAADSPADTAYYNRRWRASPPRENPIEAARRTRIIRAIEALDRRGLELLDLGCGRGHLAPHLAALGRVTGVDWSAEGVRKARQACPDGKFLCGGFFDVDLPERAYDVVVSEEVIEHLDPADQPRYMALAWQVLKAGGLLVLTTPNRPVAEALSAACLARTGRPYSDQPNENMLDPRELATLARRAGFAVAPVETFVGVDGAGGGLHALLVARKPLSVPQHPEPVTAAETDA
jgi:glycosyltransferase involved in cell wall biosynthesis/2-polyprenyl-3-methyl-5-hydroxy-6-metoxy-1,4-benzoquinol methylase